MSSHTFVEQSDLEWSHDSGCSDTMIDSTPVESYMDGGSTYAHQTKTSFCNHDGPYWYPNDIVAPRQDGGPGSHEGLYLDLETAYRDGQGFQTDEPVYYYSEYGERIDYWFHYGFSQTLDIFRHEGDWERISIRMSSDMQPREVQYFQHHTSCTLPWSEVPKFKDHPIVWSAKEAHGSYPAGADTHSGDRISGDGPLWNGHLYVDNTRFLDWYGYAGGWGEVGEAEVSTGPWGPNPHRGAPGFGTDRCDMT